MTVFEPYLTDYSAYHIAIQIMALSLVLTASDTLPLSLLEVDTPLEI